MLFCLHMFSHEFFPVPEQLSFFSEFGKFNSIARFNVALDWRLYVRASCRFSKDEPGGCTTFTIRLQVRAPGALARSIERTTTTTTTYAARLVAFPRGPTRESLCNTFTMQLHERACAWTRVNERAESAYRCTHRHADRHAECASLIIPVIIINCSDPRRATTRLPLRSARRSDCYRDCSRPGE